VDELDFEALTWMVPAEKMKIKGELEPKPHLVPLSDQAIDIIRSMPRTGKYVFPSDHAETHQPFRANALVGAIERTGIKSTMHGCRTSFRNWGADNKNHNFGVKCWSSVCRIASAMRLNCHTGTAR